MRACWNSGPIRPFTSRNDDAHSSSVASTDPPVIHDSRIYGEPGIQRSPEIATVVIRVCPGTSCGIAEPSQHEADRGKAEEGERLAGEVLPILGQTTAAVQPRYGAFDAPLDNVA